MIRSLILALGFVATAVLAPGLPRAEQGAASESAAPTPEAQDSAKPVEQAHAKLDPAAEALRKAVSSLPAGDTDEERNERAALLSFYEARGHAMLWLAPDGGFTPKAALAMAEIARAGEWGLDPRDFPLPAALKSSAGEAPAPEAIAAGEIEISQAILKYGRYARGGRIVNPSEQLSSYLDRRPQLLKPDAILAGIASAGQPDAYLRGLHPAHPQFEKLRQKYLALPGRNRKQSAEGKKLLANMEEWRWMPADMGDLYIWNNIPDFTQRVVKNGEVVRKSRIVAGEVDKQTPIFTRSLKKITFKPTWIVPDSIKVRELWPSLLRGGGLMRQWQLEVHTKDGQPVDWRKVNWAETDIRKYEVIQPNGPKTVLGKVKFSFPSQHTVFMHDTRQVDKWMFNVAKRTYSHGCMRVADPIGLAKIVLREDKGWDSARVSEIANDGPLNNEIALDRKIPVHITYFTALVDDDGKLQTFADVYGHERRITLALEGKWNRIVKGRNHLAPVELDLAGARERPYSEEDADSAPIWRRRYEQGGRRGFFETIFGE